jgi:3',5'-cyclic AMP phosphodiesterase CpdA
MKRILKYILLLIILAAFFFGAGISLAEVRLRFFSPQKTVIIPKNDTPLELPKPKETVPSENQTGIIIPEENNPEGKQESTATAEEKSFSFAILGDSQYFKAGNPNGALQKAVRNIQKENPDLVFSMGDLVSDCDGGAVCEQKYVQWKNATAPFSGKTYAMQGNHDRTGKDKADRVWAASFNFPANGPAGYAELAYSFDLENSHFVVLDSEKPKEHIINGAQRQWLEQDLAKNEKSQPAGRREDTFIFFHEPAYPVSSKIGESLDVNSGERDDLWNIITRHKVTAVFSGHEHIFSRKNINGIYQFVVGNTDSFNHDAPKPGMAEYAYIGQHYIIVNVSGNKITVKLYTIDGNLLNSFDFQK